MHQVILQVALKLIWDKEIQRLLRELEIKTLAADRLTEQPQSSRSRTRSRTNSGSGSRWIDIGDGDSLPRTDPSGSGSSSPGRTRSRTHSEEDQRRFEQAQHSRHSETETGLRRSSVKPENVHVRPASSVGARTTLQTLASSINAVPLRVSS